MRKLSVIVLAIALICSCSGGKQEPIVLLDGPQTTSVEIEPYKQQWMEIFHTVLTVEPYTEYLLEAKAMSTLPALQQGVFIGARLPDGSSVVKDTEFLAFHDNMTPMHIQFNSGGLTEMMIFCGAWVNRTVSITVADITITKLGESQLTDDKPLDAKPLNHFIPPVGWMNDPNGMVYKDGIYHLYYQHYPDDIHWGPMHWGHAHSTDLVHWQNDPIAIYPDELGTIFSGSAVLDSSNTAGFGEGAIVAIYTVNHENPHYQKQCIAYSTDNGMTFTKYPGNPVLDAGIPDFRDPKVSWSEKSGQWIMPVASGHEIRFYGSADLKRWKYLSAFGIGYGAHDGIWECPDLFDLKVEETGETKSVLLVNLNPGCIFGGSATQYFVGEFDGCCFVPDSPVQTKWMDYGKDHYATVSWNNAPGGRRIALPWMSNWQYANDIPTFPWRNAMAFPRELSLVVEEGSYILKSAPVPEVLALCGPVTSSGSYENPSRKRIRVGSLLPENKGAYCLEVTAKDGSGRAMETLTLLNKEGEKVVITMDFASRRVVFDRTGAGLASFSKDFPAVTSCAMPEGDQCSLMLLADKCSIELFVGGGRYVMTNLVFPTSPYNTAVFETIDGNLEYLSFASRPM